MYKIYFLIILLFSTLSITAQKNSGFSYGIQGGLQLNSAILPDIKLNDNITSVLEGDDVAKGVPQWADFTYNYIFGGFIKHEHGFGFGLLALNYTTAKIKKDIKFTTNDFFGGDEFTLATLERDYTYLDFSLSYNINLSDKLYFSLGATPSILLSYTGKEEPNQKDLRAFTGFGYRISNKTSITTRVELGLSEVYDGSYIHHVMIPIVLQMAF